MAEILLEVAEGHVHMMQRIACFIVIIILSQIISPAISVDSTHSDDLNNRLQQEDVIPSDIHQTNPTLRSKPLLSDTTTLSNATYVNAWTSNTMTTSASFSNLSELVGDHVVISNNWSLPASASLPEYNITSSRTTILTGSYEVMTGSYADPEINNTWPILLTYTDNYVWETVEGIIAGDNVSIALDAQDGQDSAFDVWTWDDANSDGFVDLDEIGNTTLLFVDTFAINGSEAGSYIATESGSIAIRIYAYAYAYHPGVNYIVSVDTRASIDVWSDADPEYTEFDTYELGRNITATVQYYCYTDAEVVFFDELVSVTFANFFAPDITVNAPIDLDNDIWNITWSSTDKNANDVNFYSIWFSRDGGVTFVLLWQNLTSTNYVWDSSNWLQDVYLFRIRAYSADLTSEKCSLDSPPSSYWPGDYSDAISLPINAGGVGMGGPIPSFSINTDSLSYEFGSTGNSISVSLSFGGRTAPSSITYSIYDNRSLWIQGEYGPATSWSTFAINIDGLSIGTHSLSLSIDYFGPYDREYFTVTVVASVIPITNSTTNTAIDLDLILQTLAFGVSIGSITIIVLVVVLTLQLKRNPIIEYA